MHECSPIKISIAIFICFITLIPFALHFIPAIIFYICVTLVLYWNQNTFANNRIDISFVKKWFGFFFATSAIFGYLLLVGWGIVFLSGNGVKSDVLIIPLILYLFIFIIYFSLYWVGRGVPPSLLVVHKIQALLSV